MIRKFKGWQNYLVLWVAYMLFGFGLFFAFSALSGVKLEPLPRLFVVFYIFIQTAVHCGMYLAKWRFYIDAKTGEEVTTKFD